MRTIEPLDTNLTAPDPIPERPKSTPEEVYPSIDIQTQRATNTHLKHLSEIEDTRREVKYKDMLRINVLVAIPYILSFASISAILSLAPPSDPISALESRATMIALTVPAVFPWIFALYKLKAELWNYRIGFSSFIFIYSLFTFPLLDVTVGLLHKNMPLIALLVASFIASQLYLLSIAASVKDRRKIAVPILIVTVLVMSAIVF